MNLDLKMYDPKSILIRISIAKNNMQSSDDMLNNAQNINDYKKDITKFDLDESN